MRSNFPGGEFPVLQNASRERTAEENRRQFSQSKRVRIDESFYFLSAITKITFYYLNTFVYIAHFSIL